MNIADFMATTTSKSKDLAALRWSCRRGMLELDLLFNQFLDKAYLELSAEEQLAFKELLTCTDPELFAWLFGISEPSKPEWLSLVRKIRGTLPCKSR